MIVIFKKFHAYLPKCADGSYGPQLFTGDQLTVERAVNVIASECQMDTQRKTGLRD